LGLCQRLSNNLLAVPNGSPTAFKSLSQRLLTKPWQLHPFSPKGPVSVNVYEKLKEHLKILKTISGFSPRTDIYSNMTFTRLNLM
jgi:hypothetical protein